jgi:hypothetical protein
VLLVAATNSVPLDISLGALPFEEHLIDRSSKYEIAPGVSLRTCSAEDLVVLKAFAGRDQDWLDIRGIATREAGRLDEALILRELEPLLELKGAPETAARLRDILGKARVR